MTILSEMETGQGGKWVLVDYGNNYFAYGFEQDLHSFLGFPIDQCGTKEKVMQHCNLISDLCRQNIAKYNKEIAKSSNPEGWNFLICQEQKQLEMLTKFENTLNKIEI